MGENVSFREGTIQELNGHLHRLGPSAFGSQSISSLVSSGVECQVSFLLGPTRGTQKPAFFMVLGSKGSWWQLKYF